MSPILPLLLLSLVQGCATKPDPVRDAEVQPVAPTAVAAEPERFRGTRVRWGGTIVAVENRSDATVLEVLARRLKSSGAPDPDAEGEGRFRAVLSGFLDPSDYAEGRWLTVVGALRGVEKGLIGEHPYVFPVVAAEHHRLWRSRDEIEPPPPYHYDPWWWDPWYPYRRWPYHPWW